MRRGACGALLAAVVVLLGSACSPRSGGAASEYGCRVLQRPTSLPGGLDESSGVAMSRRHPGILWTHNDSRGELELTAIDSLGGSVGRVQVAGAENEDWEDIALGPCPAGDCLYIGDTGDNAAERDEIDVWRVPEPAPTGPETAPAERFPMRFPDGPRDAEALFVLPSGDVFLLSKGRGHPVAIYRYPAPLRMDETVELELVRSLSADAVPRPHQVTAADATPDGAWIALRTYTALLLYRTEDLLGEGDPVLRVDLRPLGEAQGEGASMRQDGLVVLTSEGGGQGVPGSFSRLACALP